jgi:hypothetical protein
MLKGGPTMSNAGSAASKKLPQKSPQKTTQKSSAVGGPIRGGSESDIVSNDVAEQAKRDRLLKRIHVQAILIIILTGLLILGMPFFRPLYHYSAVDTQHRQKQLIALTMPNMTNKAILSWSTTSITEIMTMGFGDYLPHLKQQRSRFTPDGWGSFSEAFDKEKIGDKFQKSQLVLTTAPCNTAVITKQSENERHIYEWTVQMPVVMTYATNNNKTEHQKTVIELTIVRVPSSQSPAGIAIDGWKVARNSSANELCE